MNFKLFILSILVIGCNYAYGQVNNKYIQNKIRNQKQLFSKAVFETGYIIDNKKDTVDAKLLVFGKRNKMQSYLCCVIKDAHDSIRIIPAEDLFEYRIGKVVYKKIKEKNEHFFIKLLTAGEISLFEREPIPSDFHFKYYLKRTNQQGYYEISPDEANFQIAAEGQSYSNQNSNRQNTLYVSTNNIAERFKAFVYAYFTSCERVRMMVKSEVYTIYDIPAIVVEYNKCSGVN
jgi:hypothetical protein